MWLFQVIGDAMLAVTVNLLPLLQEILKMSVYEFLGEQVIFKKKKKNSGVRMLDCHDLKCQFDFDSIFSLQNMGAQNFSISVYYKART